MKDSPKRNHEKSSRLVISSIFRPSYKQLIRVISLMNKKNRIKTLSRFHAQLTVAPAPLMKTTSSTPPEEFGDDVDAVFVFPIKTSQQFSDDLSQLSIRHFAVTSDVVN